MLEHEVSIYSTQLAVEQLTATQSVLYTVPPATTVVIRDLEVWVIAAQSGLFYIAVEASGGFVIPLVAETSAAASSKLQWQGRVVMNAGDRVVGASPQPGVQVIVSGYVFPN